MDDWTTVVELLPRIVLRHPSQTRSGQAIETPTHNIKGVLQAHPQSPDKSEVYFEAVVYPKAIDVEAMYQGQREFILEKDERKKNGVVGDLEMTTVGGRSARRALVKFETDGITFERMFYFLNVEDVPNPFGLRIVLDPRSPTNFEILERMEIGNG